MSTPTESFSGQRVQRRADRAERLGEHHRGPAVQEAVGLRVALDRHGRHHPLGADLDQLDPHPVVQRTHALRHRGEELLDVHGRRLQRRSWPHHCRPTRLSVAAARVGTCPRPRPVPTPPDDPGSCSSTATRWPTARSSRCRWRTSRPSTGQHTNAVYGFTSMLVNVLRDEQPTHVAVAFDVSRQTFRLEQYAEYKAKRNKTPTEFSSQLPIIEQLLTRFGITYLKKDGFEADDIIATLTTRAVAAGMEVLILTGDRDSLQLVSDDATVLYPMRGVSDLARMTPGRRRGQVRRAAAALPRAGGDRGGDLRQPARRARRRPGLRGQVDQPVRRPRQRHHPCRQDHRQEGRGAARAPRRRDPQPPPQRPGLRPRPRARARRPGPRSRGTGTRR